MGRGERSLRGMENGMGQTGLSPFSWEKWEPTPLRLQGPSTAQRQRLVQPFQPQLECRPGGLRSSKTPVRVPETKIASTKRSPPVSPSSSQPSPSPDTLYHPRQRSRSRTPGYSQQL